MQYKLAVNLRNTNRKKEFWDREERVREDENMLNLHGNESNGDEEKARTFKQLK